MKALCFTGGGSALLPSPIPPITLEDMGATTRVLQGHGATIQQLNLVRKHTELLKGGGLAKLALPAKVRSGYTMAWSKTVSNPHCNWSLSLVACALHSGGVADIVGCDWGPAGSDREWAHGPRLLNT